MTGAVGVTAECSGKILSGTSATIGWSRIPFLCSESRNETFNDSDTIRVPADPKVGAEGIGRNRNESTSRETGD